MLLAALAAAAAGPHALAASSPDGLNYNNSPVTSTGRTVPRVLLVFSKDHKLHQQAYNGFTDMDRDGRPDTGFNPSVPYYGYFDSASCYRYVGSIDKYREFGDINEYFVRTGPTLEDDPQQALDDARPEQVKARGIKAARAAHYATGERIGICQKPHSEVGGNYSGNWLNYVTTTRMDVVRKVLYGGYRRLDENVTRTDKKGKPLPGTGVTQLQSSLVPRDAHTWGTDVLSDDRWASETELTNYYDISRYTPFPKPKRGSAHFFARTRNKSLNDYVLHFPVVEFILDANDSYLLDPKDPKYYNIFDPDINLTGSAGRYFDWVLNQAPNPSTLYALRPTSRSQGLIRSLTIHVNVCDRDSPAPGENCRAYPNGNLKPSGLLQQNGESGQMLFGLLTGSYDYLRTAYKGDDGPGQDTRRKGGVLRNHMGDLSGAINPETGQFIEGGLIRNIDSLIIAESPTYGGVYLTAASWGNPVGELLYEGVRYFSRISEDPSRPPTVEPTADFVPVKKETKYHPEISATYYTQWKSLPPVASAECAKPVIILIAEAEADYDGDTAVNVPGGLRAPPLSSLPQAVAAGLPDAFDMARYLDLITGIEGYAHDGRNYYYAAEPYRNPNKAPYDESNEIWGDCTPKRLSSLNDVLGLCPNLPSFEGTYSAAAVAYYARTHSFSPPDSEEQPLDIYVLTLTPSFPPLAFPVYGASGKPERNISLMPTSMSNRDPYTTYNRLIGFLNYYIIDWQTDSRGTPYRVVVRVNFEDASQGRDFSYGGSNWDSDLLVEYTLELLAASPSSKTGGVSYRMERDPAIKKEADDPSLRTSGALKVKGGTYWAFRAPYDGSFVIEPGEVAGLIVGQWKVMTSVDKPMTTGYSISGSTHDGIYMDIGDHGGIAKYGTPPECNWPAGYGAPDASGSKCNTRFGTSLALGKGDDVSKKVWRTFEFAHDPSRAGTYLPSPMNLAAKYGGFTDYDRNGRPDPGEWEGENGLPANLFEATRVSELPSRLESIFREIARSISTSTATAASIDTTRGGGVSVQTLYYPVYTNPGSPSQRLRWVGSVYGLFIDKWGNLREDTDHDGELAMANGKDGDLGDLIVTFNSLSHHPVLPPPCYEFGSFISRCFDPIGDNSQELMPDGRRHPANVHRIDTLFDTGHWLAHLDPASLAAGPREEGSAATLARGRRRILYGRPSGSGTGLGVFNAPESLPELARLMLHDNYRDSLPGAQDRAAAAKALVDWIAGIEIPGWRGRTVGDPWTDDRTPVVWRLGDVINSKPILVGGPAVGYDTLYGDRSYTAYREAWAGRRQMAYFGANDGMLHAVNVGFPATLKDGKMAFLESDGTGKPHERGSEVWAFIPQSLLPHLRWLPDPAYGHSYYVDLKPLINDIKIDGEWRTVLLGGLRLGGRPIETPDPQAAGSEHFYSEIFALDITDPERDPRLLWRYSTSELGLTTGMPAVISHEGAWYAILPTGPASDTPVPAGGGAAAYVRFGADSPYQGHSYQRARLIVLDAATGAPHQANSAQGFLTAEEGNSFFNNPFLPAAQIRESPWTNHALYYGLTVSRDRKLCTDSGAVYRLQTVDTEGRPLPVASWRLRRLLSTGRPVTGAVNSAVDTIGNVWVVFGTGRLWSADDMTPCGAADTALCRDNHRQYIYGVKEELGPEGLMTFADRTPDADRIMDVSGATVLANGKVTGLASQPNLTPSGDGSVSYVQIEAQLRSGNTAGYRRALAIGPLFYPKQPHSFEMSLTQPKIVAAGGGRSFMSFTTFEPRAASCGDYGDGYLYLVNTFTGLPDPSTLKLFSAESQPGQKPAASPAVPGAVTTGKGAPSETFLVVSSAGVTVSASAPDASTASIFIPEESVSISRLTSWREVLDSGFSLSPENMVSGLN
jgi:type IV pilus assembly protein PilY1